MNSQIFGTKFTTSDIQPRLSNISIEGIEITFGTEVFNLPYQRYPWFKFCSLVELENVQFDGSAIEWPDAMIDLELDLLRHPEKEGCITSVANWLELRALVRQKEVIKDAASRAGSVRSHRKAVASRANGAKGGRPKKDLC